MEIVIPVAVIGWILTCLSAFWAGIERGKRESTDHIESAVLSAFKEVGENRACQYGIKVVFMHYVRLAEPKNKEAVDAAIDAVNQHKEQWK